MGKDHKSKPSGSNKEEELAIKPIIPAENLEINHDMREKHTREDELAHDIKERHPNKRNKEDSTIAGGSRQ